MFSTPLIQAFTPNAEGYKDIEHVISISDASPGYLVLISSKGESKHFALPYAPSEAEIIALGEYIHASIQIPVPDEMSNQYWDAICEVDRMEWRIRDFCMSAIEGDSLDRLANGSVIADHHYVCFSADDGYVSVNLYKDDELIDTLNSNELLRWLTDHPETPTYYSKHMDLVERAILKAVNITIFQGMDVNSRDGHDTGTQRLMKKLLLVDKLEGLVASSLAFTKQGVKIPAM